MIEGRGGKYINNTITDLDCVIIFVPKFNNNYRPIGKHMFNVLMPMGLMAIADFVHKKGYKIQILHLGLKVINNPNFSLDDYLKKVNPRVVGFSLHWYHQSYDTMETARKVKLFNPNIVTVLGGLTASYFHKEIIEDFNYIDAVIRGDGEVPFLELLDNISKEGSGFSRIPNLTWRYQNITKINDIAYVAQDEDLDRLNFTNFKLLKNYELYIKMKDMRGARWLKGVSARILNRLGPPTYFPLVISKGCSVNCSYCGGSKLNHVATCGRQNVSVRSINKVLESIMEAREYGFKEIIIQYLPFINYPNYFEELFEAIKRRNLELDYFFACWALPSEGIINAFNNLRINGSKLHIEITPETGSENIRRLNKGFYHSNDELIKVLRFIESLNIPVLLFFTVGLPFETSSDIESTLNFQDFLRKSFKNIISISTSNPPLEPGSPMFIMPEKYGIIKTRNCFKDFIKSSKDINKDGYLTTRLGYYIQSFSKPCGNLPEEESFRRSLQEIICRSSCRIAEFLFPSFLRSDSVFIRRQVFIFSR
jgi:radical SAM superfamily enzyme YgiQ (UPF0313 family)